MFLKCIRTAALHKRVVSQQHLTKEESEDVSCKTTSSVGNAEHVSQSTDKQHLSVPFVLTLPSALTPSAFLALSPSPCLIFSQVSVSSDKID